MSPWWGLLLVPLAVAVAGHLAHRADWGHPGLNIIDGLNRLFCRLLHGLRSEPVPLPEGGPALVVANHLSGLDPLLMVAACDRPLRFIIAHEQYRRRGLNWLFRAAGCIPVERSRNPRQALRAARDALARGEVVALFPHGRILKPAERRGEQDAPLKPGVAWLAAASEAPIIPLHLSGIGGVGKAVLAVAIPSRARLRAHPPIHCAGRADDGAIPLDSAGCLEAVRAAIEGRA